MKKSSIATNSENLLLYGIVSFEKDYRLEYFINKIAGIELTKSNDLLNFSFQQSIIEVPFYEYIDFDFEYFLIANKQNGVNILDKLKNINYWLVLKKKAFEFDLTEFERKINSLAVVLGCFHISDEKEREKLAKLLFC